jgi:exodeoxyribonuclease V alpha subunit
MSTPPLSAAVFLGHLSPARAALFAHLDEWVERGELRALDRAFAAFLAQNDEGADNLALLGAVFASHQLGRGHACVDLRAVLGEPEGTLGLPSDGARWRQGGAAGTSPASLLRGVSLTQWTQALDAAGFTSSGEGNSPLVRIGARLYLRRYWRYEQSVRAAIDHRVNTPSFAASDEALPSLQRTLDALFPGQVPGKTDWQKAACALVARQGFGIITGGPGTGKTTTVVRLLAVLQHLAMSSGTVARRLRIRLAAPTGKAAARLSESIAGAVAGLQLQDLPDAQALRDAIPTGVTTVHRLLGSRPDTRHFRHDARHPLPVDVLVLDEASMLDLEMVAAVFAALPPGAQLILLGDKDQLASVEAGAVLGDLCQRADDGHYLPQTDRWLAAVTGQSLDTALIDEAGLALDQAVAKLRVSYRFDAASGIGRLADAANRGDVSAVYKALGSNFADLSFQRQADDATLRRLAIEGAPQGFAAAGMTARAGVQPPVGYRQYLRVMRETQPHASAPQAALDAWALDVLRTYGDFQLLCAVRAGPLGVEALNTRIANLLRAEGLLDASPALWYAGRPVMITRNDHALGLMNGDVGITLATPAGTAADGSPAWALRIAFRAPHREGGVHWVMPSRLNDVETVFAMTVHKSQGSEFSHAALVLPAQPSRVLTRELVYTGVTRARHWFTMLAPGSILDAAIAQRVQRTSGLSADTRKPDMPGDYLPTGEQA